jgi:hypothetical protein
MQQARRLASSREFIGIDEIGRTSGSVFGSDPAGDRMRLLRLETAWGRAVGTHLKSISRPASYSAGRLAVEVISQTWKKELDHLAPSILARLAHVMPSEPITEITFRVRRGGDLAAADRAGAAARIVSAGEGRQAPARIEVLREDDLQGRLSSVMGRYLARAGRAAASR